MCHFTSIAEQNFLAGNAQIYYEGKSVGTTYLDPLSTKNTIDLSLSRDFSILTTRKPLKKFSSETKISDKVKQERSFEITLIISWPERELLFFSKIAIFTGLLALSVISRTRSAFNS